MALPREAIELIKQFEGYLKPLDDGTDRVRPYYCPAGVPTIGWGTTRYPDGRRVAINDPPIDRATATFYLEHELREAEAACDRLTTVKLHPLSRRALVSFIYNCGAGAYQASTLRKKVNAQAWQDVPRELAKWRFGGGRVLPGLVRRRAAEAELFMRGVRLSNSLLEPMPGEQSISLSQPLDSPTSSIAHDLPFWRKVLNWILS